MNYVIISHTDADGWFSASIVLQYLQQKYKHATVKCFAYNYGQPTERIEEYLNKLDEYLIFMTDMTLPDEFMSKYAKHIWHMDHHKSVLETSKPWMKDIYREDSTITIEGYKDTHGNQANQIAACELVWLKLFPDTPMPRAVWLAGRYDIWDLNEEILAFNTYLNTRLPGNKGSLKYLEKWFNDLFTEDGIRAAEKEGAEALTWLRRFNAINSNKYTSIVKMFGSTIAMINCSVGNSKFFDYIVQNHPEIEGLFTFHYKIKDQHWECGCYSSDTHQEWDALSFIQKFRDKVDNILAMGGHKNACGFEFKDNPEKIFDCIEEIL